MHIDQARNAVFELILQHRQNRVLLEHAESDPDVLQVELARAEESITYGVIDRQIAGAAKATSNGEYILATYGAEWVAIENGREYVDRIARNVAFNAQTAEIAAQIEGAA